MSTPKGYSRELRPAPGWLLTPLDCGRTTSGEICAPRRLLGNSLWKRHGFHTTCLCFWEHMNYVIPPDYSPPPQPK